MLFETALPAEVTQNRPGAVGSEPEETAMPCQLKVSLGQYSSAGCKPINQDFHGARIPTGSQLDSKGITVALADGISSSSVSQIASEAAVSGFLEDYYCTSDAWSVKKSALSVLNATNSWLYAQTRRSRYRYDRDRGYVCTFSTLILKSTTAHLFHAGDTRICRLRGGILEQLTDDHRLHVAGEKSYLSRAMGIHPKLEIDYRSLSVNPGDLFVLVTDGVHEYLEASSIAATVGQFSGDLERAAETLVTEALEQGSDDNLTVQLVRVEQLPVRNVDEVYRQLTELPFSPSLNPRSEFDGYRIIREIHASSRSHVYLAVDKDSGGRVVLKTPSVDLRGEVSYLEGFLMEEWIARRINSAHVLKPFVPPRARNFIYLATEFVDGQTLDQWMVDNPEPDLETVRGIVEQVARGLRAFHRMEMLHQDLRPNNIMIDRTGTVKIIDFGSTRVAGIMEISSPVDRGNLLGTFLYTAPEYFLGERGSPCSDQYSLGVIAYQMLSGALPYGTEVSKCRSGSAQRRLKYRSILEPQSRVPLWVDEAIRKAVHINPLKRYDEVSEFVYDLRHPNQAFLQRTRPPLLERNPVAVWQGVSFILGLVIVALLVAGDCGGL